MQKLYFLRLAVCAVFSVTAIGSAFAASEIDHLPKNLMTADLLEEQLQEEVQAGDAIATADEQGLSTQSLSPARGGHNRGGYRPNPRPYPDHRYRPSPRPNPRPYPDHRYRPSPRPNPRPYPDYQRYRPDFPRRTRHGGYWIFTCYAQSIATGQPYWATGYSPGAAQNAALNSCINWTGYQCIPLGCN